MASQEEILRSNEAELILKSETFKQSLETLREEYINLWLHTLPEERDLREQLHKSIKLLPEIERKTKKIKNQQNLLEQAGNQQNLIKT